MSFCNDELNTFLSSCDDDVILSITHQRYSQITCLFLCNRIFNVISCASHLMAIKKFFLSKCLQSLLKMNMKCVVLQIEQMRVYKLDMVYLFDRMTFDICD